MFGVGDIILCCQCVVPKNIHTHGAKRGVIVNSYGEGRAEGPGRPKFWEKTWIETGIPKRHGVGGGGGCGV